MKTFKQLTQKINEITEPTDAEEGRFRKRMKRFLKKHHSTIVKKDDIAGNPDSHYTGSTKKRGGKRIADPKTLDTDDDVYEQLIDEVLSAGEKTAKERFVKGMKKNKDRLMKRYGDDWQAVMHATATKKAVQTESIEENQLDELSTKKMVSYYRKASDARTSSRQKLGSGKYKDKQYTGESVEEHLDDVMSNLYKKMVQITESYDGVNSSYIDRIAMVADDISQCVDRLVYQHDKYQEEMEDGGSASDQDSPSVYPGPTGKMYDAKHMYRSLEDVRDMLRSREIAEAVEDCTETFLDEDTGVEVGDKIKYKKDGKGQARTGVVSMVEGTDIYIHKGATLLNYDDIIMEGDMKSYKDSYKDDKKKKDKLISAKDKYKVDSDHANTDAIKRSRHVYEAEDLDETYKAGKITLDDRKTINISKKDAAALNEFYGKLSPQNRKSMEKTLKKSASDFSEILKFAKEAV